MTKHTCKNIAPECVRSTMSTWKRRIMDRKVTCKACSDNVRNGVPQHGERL